ncbi:hypothetical protein PTNB73_05331 [Pyrenophora teres f. teres]|uniref:Zf-RING-2 multi-domain protein n=1 Tax=Pyrenophora teres f. teres TaxID=97479 RepID=A0A6S6VZV7_9PLEO|nr:hypothetical protein HRS9139_05097 [Pyrenophora teres f. teres]KAE8864448.1 hypothetical protein PTNB29_04412 [Pyrenophora teres f. teres]KAE8867237.1 hypothetical protein PTNB73_05331 [Pyrenophora teres f. teres]CAE7030977.1 zf-RING-2 multi-domain protein [Pyrenophora teres f. teres]
MPRRPDPAAQAFLASLNPLECSICSEAFDSADHIAVEVQGCRHVIGQACLSRWVESSSYTHDKCPTCRGPLHDQNAIVQQQQTQPEATQIEPTRTARLTQRMKSLLRKPKALQSQVPIQGGVVLGLARAGHVISHAGTRIVQSAKTFHPGAPRKRLQRNPASQSPPVNTRPRLTPDAEQIPLRMLEELHRPQNPDPRGWGRVPSFHGMYATPGNQNMHDVQEANRFRGAALNALYSPPLSYETHSIATNF